jgi:hypothetical protein
MDVFGTSIFSAIGNAVKKVATAVTTTVKAVATVATTAVKKVATTVKTVATKVATAVVNTVTKAVAAVTNTVTKAVDTVKNTVKKVANTVVAVKDKIVEKASEVVAAVKKTASSALQKVSTAAKKVVNDVGNFMQGMYDTAVYCAKTVGHAVASVDWGDVAKKAATVLAIAAVATVAVVATVATAGAAGAAIGISAGMTFGLSGAAVTTIGSIATGLAYTVAGGIAVNALSQAGEIVTGHNVIRDDFMGGSQGAYDALNVGLVVASAGINYLGSTNPALAPDKASKSNPNNSTDLPPNKGAVPGTEETITLQPGDKVGRYGDIGPFSNYVTQPGTPPEDLSLPPGTDISIYNEFEVLQPIPNTVKSIVEPFYNQPGLGSQYILPNPILELIPEFLKRLP